VLTLASLTLSLRHLAKSEAGCLRPTPADNLPILARIQPAEIRHIWSFTVDPGSLLQSALICPCSAARMRPKRLCLPLPETNLLRFFAGPLYQFELFENKWKEQSDSSSD